ncbi:hypothetical protein HZH68_002247 [Vespula germanica]|uniref:Uncharacterized protein n=1 Tax=Vespula germanica TaxID=30212 RepID=A0A834KVK4_VESGE|nr:hypothetical protein HZH68_002247 [Vespula germanica]
MFPIRGKRRRRVYRSWLVKMRSRTCERTRADLSARNRETGGNTTFEAANGCGISIGGLVGGLLSRALHFRASVAFVTTRKSKKRVVDVTPKIYDSHLPRYKRLKVET